MRSAALILLLLCNSALGAYQPRQLYIINWGAGPDRFQIRPYEEFWNQDSSEAEIHTGGGPSKVFIDEAGNALIYSYEFRQFKLFDSAGQLLLDKSQFEGLADIGEPEDFFIDTLNQIYLVTVPETNFVSIYDYEGKVVDKIYPYDESPARICRMYWDVSAELFFNAIGDTGYMAYYDRQFRPIAIACMRATDGYLYAVDYDEIFPYSIKFIKYLAPERQEAPVSIDSFFVEILGDTLYDPFLITGGQGTLLYVSISRNGVDHEIIYIFDLKLDLVDEIHLAPSTDNYGLGMSPFVDRQGQIYEFLFREDGLHVVKWTKQQ